MISQPQQANPNMAMFAQMAQQGAPGMGGGMPQQQPPQMPPQQMQRPPAPAQMPPGAPPAPPGMPPQPPQSGGAAPRFTPEELAALGRFGDTIVAHLTPGEVTVPLPLQTPKVLATIKKAAEDKGADPQKLVAGAPESTINPQTGLAEYNFMSAFLPMALGLAGAAAAPFTGGASLGLSSAAMAGIGGGLGTAAGGLLTGQKPLQAGLSGLGAGLGGYALGSLFNPAAEVGKAAATAGGQGVAQGATQAASQAATSAIPNMSSIPASGLPSLAGNAGQQAANSMSNLWGALPNGMSFDPATSIGSAIGGRVGSMMGAPQRPMSAPRPNGFDDHMTPVDQLPSWQEQLGQSSYKGPFPQYNGFDPLSSNPAQSTGYNFYPIPPQIPRA